MHTYGIRISDNKNGVLHVKLPDILKEIQNGADLNWCILFIDGTPNSGKGNIVNDYKPEVNKSKEGLRVKWDEICLIGDYFYQIFETLILGSKTYEFLHRYDNDQEMYESCDIVIELVDCAFWQIFSKNQELIDRLKKKFKEIEILKSNFEP